MTAGSAARFSPWARASTLVPWVVGTHVAEQRLTSLRTKIRKVVVIIKRGRASLLCAQTRETQYFIKVP